MLYLLYSTKLGVLNIIETVTDPFSVKWSITINLTLISIVLGVSLDEILVN